MDIRSFFGKPTSQKRSSEMVERDDKITKLTVKATENPINVPVDKRNNIELVSISKKKIDVGSVSNSNKTVEQKKVGTTSKSTKKSPGRKKAIIISDDEDDVFEVKTDNRSTFIVSSDDDENMKVEEIIPEHSKNTVKKEKKMAPKLIIEKKEVTESPQISQKKSKSKSSTNTEKEKPKEKRAISGAYKPKWLSGDKEPPMHGSKPIPKGKPNCLEGMFFVLTGLNESLTRDELSNLIQNHGGVERSAVSSKTTYLVAGFEMEDGRPIQEGSKYKAAIDKRIDIINEDKLMDMIRKSDAKASALAEKEAEMRKNKEEEEMKKRIEEEIVTQQESPINENKPRELNDDITLLTSKYAPRRLDEIAGNKMTIAALETWLKQWEDIHITKTKEVSYNKQNPGARAALLSGPPGIGKTTTATILCRQLKYDIIEMNASDKRNMLAVRNALKDSTSSKAFGGFHTVNGVVDNNRKKVIIMDEVDGMSSGDRGGMAELIKIIKLSRTPIICICNDRDSPKVRSLASSCYDLSFTRPSSKEVLSRLQYICQREHISVDMDSLNALVESTGGDFRQILNQLQIIYTHTVCAEHASNVSARQVISSFSKDKLLDLSPFEAARSLLTASHNLPMQSRYDMVFSDYEMTPLIVQQNYLDSIKSNGALSLEQMADAADSFCDMERIHDQIMKNNSWSLLPSMAMLTVRAGYKATGKFVFPRFPMALGKYSTIRKNGRLFSELQSHLLTHISGNRLAISMDYFNQLNEHILKPLRDGNPSETVSLMDSYGVTRDDVIDILNGIMLGRTKSLFDEIPGKSKSAFTRIYNNANHMSTDVFADADSMFKKVTKGKKGKEKETSQSQKQTEGSTMDFDDFENEDAILSY